MLIEDVLQTTASIITNYWIASNVTNVHIYQFNLKLIQSQLGIITYQNLCEFFQKLSYFLFFYDTID